MSTTRVLLLGAGGMLAHDIAALAPRGAEVIARTRSETDVTVAADVAVAVRDARPAVLINCAAYTNVDQAESDAERAFAVNRDAVGTIGRAALQNDPNTFVVHFSTDYVFAGGAGRPYREDDATTPLGAYGRSKLGGEHALAASGAAHLIIRTQWLFGRHGRSFPRTMWERAHRAQTTRVVNDQTGRPTRTVDLALATWRLVMARQRARQSDDTFGRIVHIANTGTATWFDVAARVFLAAGVPALLSACSSEEYPMVAPRPRYSVLDTARYEAAGHEALPPWQAALDEFLRELQQETIA